MAIAGFNNNDLVSNLWEPQLTTIDYPGRDMGEIAAGTLVNHLKGISDLGLMKTIIIRSELIVRQSSQRRLEPQSKVVMRKTLFSALLIRLFHNSAFAGIVIIYGKSS